MPGSDHAEFKSGSAPLGRVNSESTGGGIPLCVSRPRLDRFQATLDGMNVQGATGLSLWHALPESERRRMEQRRLVQIDDRRYVDGLVAFKSRKPRRVGARSRSPFSTREVNFSPTSVDDWRRGTEALATIPAETYLEVLAPESEPHRGKCRCPLPDHEDNNPSATYRDSVWYCHVCATGGGIFTIGAAISGLSDHGSEFVELRRWLAERMLGAAV